MLFGIISYASFHVVFVPICHCYHQNSLGGQVEEQTNLSLINSACCFNGQILLMYIIVFIQSQCQSLCLTGVGISITDDKISTNKKFMEFSIKCFADTSSYMYCSVCTFQRMFLITLQETFFLHHSVLSLQWYNDILPR